MPIPETSLAVTEQIRWWIRRRENQEKYLTMKEWNKVSEKSRERERRQRLIDLGTRLPTPYEDDENLMAVQENQTWMRILKKSLVDREGCRNQLSASETWAYMAEQWRRAESIDGNRLYDGAMAVPIDAPGIKYVHGLCAHLLYLHCLGLITKVRCVSMMADLEHIPREFGAYGWSRDHWGAERRAQFCEQKVGVQQIRGLVLWKSSLYSIRTVPIRLLVNTWARFVSTNSKKISRKDDKGVRQLLIDFCLNPDITMDDIKQLMVISPEMIYRRFCGLPLYNLPDIRPYSNTVLGRSDPEEENLSRKGEMK